VIAHTFFLSDNSGDNNSTGRNCFVNCQSNGRPAQVDGNIPGQFFSASCTRAYSQNGTNLDEYNSLSAPAGSGDPTNGTDDGSGPLRTIVDAAGNPLTGNYDIEVTLYPQIYYIGGSNALHQLALGEPSFSGAFQSSISVADSRYARIQPVGCSTQDLQLSPVIGVAIFEDKQISQCDLNDVSLDNNDTSSVNTLFAIPNQPIDRESVNGQSGSPIGTRRMNFLDLRNISGYRRGPFFGNSQISYPENDNEQITPITFRATGSVSSSLRICPFATLLPVGLIDQVGTQSGDLSDLISGFPRSSSKTQHNTNASFYQNFVYTGCRFTGSDSDASGIRPATADGYYTVKASFFTV
jgi:hypothetical protein